MLTLVGICCAICTGQPWWLLLIVVDIILAIMWQLMAGAWVRGLQAKGMA